MRTSQSLRVGELAVLFIAYFLLYVLTLSNVLSVATDSISYINEIDRGRQLFHPHHLLYAPLAYMWIALSRQVGVHVDSIILVSGLNAIFGSLSLCVFYSFLRVRLACDRFTALLGTSLPAFSFAFWYYSGTVEVYIIPLFLLWLAFYALTADHITAKTFLLVGFLNAVAVLVAEMSVLFATVVFLAAWCCYRRGNCSLSRSLANYIVAAVPTVAFPYLGALLYVGRGSFRGSLYWLTLYAHRTRFWNAASTSALAKAAVGIGQAFIGSHFLFALPRVRLEIGKMLPGFYLTHNTYLVRNLKTGVAYLLAGLSVCLFGLVVFTLTASLARWSKLSLSNRLPVYLLLVWLVTYGVFVFFYTAVNAKLWIVQVFCIWMLFLILLFEARSNFKSIATWSKVVLVSAVSLLFFVNFEGSIRFTKERDNDYYYSRIEPLLRASDRDDLVIIGTAWKFGAYLQRYGKAPILSLTSVFDNSGATSESLQKVEFAINRTLAAGGKVVVSSEAVEPEKETMQLYPGIAAFGTLWDKYRQCWCERESSAGSVYVLERGRAESAQAPGGNASVSECKPMLVPNKVESTRTSSSN